MLQLTLLNRDIEQIKEYRNSLIEIVAASAFAITSQSNEEILRLKLFQGKLQLIEEILQNLQPTN